jgi:hypothetical protein
MADNLNPKDLEQIEKYLRASGLNANELRNRMDAIKNSTVEFNRELLNAQQHFDDINSEFTDLSSQFKNVLDDLKKMDSTSSLINKNFSKLGDIADKLKNDAKGYSDLSKKDLEKLQEKAKIEIDNLKIRKQELQDKFKNLSQERLIEISQQKKNKDLAKQASQYLELQGIIDDNGQLINDENNYINKLLGLVDQRIEKEKQLEKAVGVTGDALKALSKIPGVGDFLNVEEASSAMREYAKNLQESGVDITSASAKLKIAGKGLSTAFSGLKDKLTDPVTILTTFVKIGLKADEQITQLGKSLGVSKSAAMGMRSEMATFARESGDSFINTDRLLKAQGELSQQLGIAVKFSNEELATFSKLTELTGLTAEEAGKLAQASAAAGVSTEAYTDGIREGAFNAMQATNTHFEMKDVMQDISKLSAGTLIKFQGNPKAIAATVVEAKKLGLTLDQVNKTGESLLNFESSIESELKAELMTGKQLNLERARAAALAGDQATLTKEIGEQVGTLNDYQNMNVLAQQSLAEAFGMSRDEMSDMLMKQEAVAQYGEEASQLNKEQLDEMKRKNMSASEYLQYQEQQRAAQDKFTDAVTKLQTIFANFIDGPIGMFLDLLADGAGLVAAIIGKWYIFYPLVGIVALSYLPKILGGFKSIAGSLGSIFSGAKEGFKSLMGGLSGFKDKIKDAFSGTKSQFAGGSFSKGKELVAKKQAAAAAAETGTKGAETASTAAGKSEAGGDGSKFKTKMQNIADGIKAFADKDVLKGALTLIPASIGLLLFAPGVLGIKAVEQVNGEKFQEAMYGIAYGIADFGKNVTAGALVKLLFGGIALTAFALGVPALLLLQLVNGTLIENTLGGIGRGIAAFSKNVSYGDLIKGAVAIALFGASLIPFAYALNMLAEVKMENILAAGAGLLIFGAAVLGLGALMMGPGAFIFGAGILAMIALGGAMMVLGAGLKVVSEGGAGIATLFRQLSELDATKLDAVAPALKTIGEAIMYLGAGGVMSALGNLLGGDSPSKMIQDIAASASGITQAASGLQLMATALQQVSSALSTIDTSKLEALSDFSESQSESVVGGAIKGITDFITSPIKTIGETISGGEEGVKAAGGIDLSPMVSAINEVRDAVNKLYSKNTTINMDGTKVGTTLTQGSYKVA